MDVPTNMAQRRGLIGAAVLGLIALSGYVLWQLDPWAEHGDGLPASFQLDLQQHFAVDPGLIRYELDSQAPVPFAEVRGLATGPDDRVYVAGDQAVQVFGADGQPESRFPLSGPANCVAVAGAEHAEPGRIYAGVGGTVQVLHADGRPAGQWQVPGEAPVLTSLAVAVEDIFVSDAASRQVWHFKTDGQLAGQIGQPDPTRQLPGFIVPSPFFDVASGADGLVHIVNPGAQQITTYSYEGDLGGAWGTAGSGLGDFFGCCNPAHFAILPDGRFVTSEKGIPRIKVYSPQGQFECVVAGPEQLGVDIRQLTNPRQSADELVFDVAVDRQGRVLVLDPQARSVRIYVIREDTSGAQS